MPNPTPNDMPRRKVYQFGQYHREIWYLGRLWYSSGKYSPLVAPLTEFAPGYNGYYREWK